MNLNVASLILRNNATDYGTVLNTTDGGHHKIFLIVLFHYAAW